MGVMGRPPRINRLRESLLMPARKRDGRTYITVHDGMPDHPKIDGLSDAAFRLLVSTWCWCSRHLTNGHVPTATWSKRGTAKARRELIAAGLVEQVADGVLVHDYLEHQRSAEEVAELSAARSEAGRRGGKARASRQASAKQVPDGLSSKTQAESVTEVASHEATTQPPSVAAQPQLVDVPRANESDTKRAQRLTRTYTDRVPMSNFPAVMGVVRKAMAAGHGDEAISDALERLAKESRPVTVDVLRIEIEGMTPRARTSGPRLDSDTQDYGSVRI